MDSLSLNILYMQNSEDEGNTFAQKVKNRFHINNDANNLFTILDDSYYTFYISLF